MKKLIETFKNANGREFLKMASVRPLRQFHRDVFHRQWRGEVRLAAWRINGLLRREEHRLSEIEKGRAEFRL